MADISKITLLNGTTYDLKDAKAFRPGTKLFTTNSFAPEELKSFYYSKIDNAFYASDQRFTATFTIDSTQYDTSSLFDGSYEGGINIPDGKSGVITVDYSGQAGSKFPGYPYGFIYISFYAGRLPQTITGRVYNNYASQGVGWKDLSFQKLDSNGYIWYAQQNYYGLQTLEITITAYASSTYNETRPVELEFYATRPDPAITPVVSKYRAETLYYPLTAPSFVGSLTGNASTATKATQDESGNNIKASYASSMSISDHTITLKNKNGASLGTVTVPDNNTTYTANTSKLVTTTVPNVTSVGSAPTLGTAIPADDITAWNAGSTPTLGTAIPADDITAWTTNTPTSASVSNGVLTIATGAAASLSYTAKSIPNVTSVGSVPSLSYTAKSIPNVTSVGSAPTLGTAITVATGSLAANGGGGTVATGITAS